MTDLREDLVTLVDEEGQEHSFMVLDILMVNEQEYAILVPADEGVDADADEQEAVIFRIVENDDEQTLLVVEDDDEWQAVAAAWEEQADYDDDDDDDEDDEL